MTERQIVAHCAPTLAGMKTGSLFRCPFESAESLKDEIERLNRLLERRGVTVTALAYWSGSALIYVYRGRMLEREMDSGETVEFLERLGYTTCGAEELIGCLRCRLREPGIFPHEIGLFLGYPLGDVVGFIRNKGRNCKSCGLWKVYCDQQSAEKLFEKYRKCTQVYCRRFREGTSLLKLTVAA